MKSLQNWYLALLFLICCTICLTESRYRDKDRQRDRKRGDKNGRIYSSPATSSASSASIMSSTTTIMNLCSRDRDMKLLCYCSPDDYTNTMPAIKADCRVLEKEFPENDSTWLAFHQQRSLRHLKLTVQKTGFMDYIPTKYLEILTNLTTLNIEYSQVLIVKSFAFANLQNLERITLMKNLINILDRDSFSNHILLKELILSYNQISEIDRFAFRNLHSLEKLQLTANNITNLHEEVFSELGKLLELKLDSNFISVLTRDIFKGLGNLKILKLTHNNLNFIGDTVFSELWSLQELELDDNRIERISERALDGLNNLKTLNLRNNQLKKMDNGVLRGVPALLSINLQENSLETLTFYNVQPIMDNLLNSASELSVSDNRFVCDCRLSWMYELRNRTKNINLKNSLEEIECWLHYGKNRIQSSSSSSNDVSLDAIKNRISNTANIGGISSSSSVIKSNDQNQRQIHNYGSNIKRTGDINNIAKKLGYPQNNNNNRGKNTDFDNEYYDDEASLPYELDIEQQTNINHNTNNNDNHGGQIVELFKLQPESLPCPEEFIEPTDLPLSRESIGMDIRTTHVASSSSKLLSFSYFNYLHIFNNILLLNSFKNFLIDLSGIVIVLIFYS